MMYPFLKIDGDSEIVHSAMLPNGEVKVYIEKPDTKDGFHHASCLLSAYRWGLHSRGDYPVSGSDGMTDHLISEFARQGGLENALSF